MNTLVLIGASHSFFLAILVALKSKRILSDLFLGLFLFLNAVLGVVIYYAYENNAEELVLYLFDFDVLFAPMFYLYIYHLTRPKEKFKKYNLLHLVPYLLTSTYFTFTLTSDDITYMEEGNLGDYSLVFVFMQFIVYAAIPVYVILSLDTLQKYKRKLRNNFSNEEGINLKWAEYLVWFVFIIWGIFFTLEITNYAIKITSFNWLPIAYFLSSFFILYLAIFGIKQTSVFTDKAFPVSIEEEKTEELQDSAQKYEKSKISDDELNSIKNKIISYFEKDKPYLMAKLSLKELSSTLEVSTHTLSQVFNTELDTTFYDFVNNFRIEEFKNVIEQNKFEGYTLLAIAFECGFNSKATFNRVFKEITGLTPTQYFKNKKKNPSAE